MSPAVATGALCTPACVTGPVPRVLRAELVRRYAALAYEIGLGVAQGERLAEPHALRARARGILGALGVRVEEGPERLTVDGPRLGRVNGPRPGTLIVANHISWLDVVSLLAVEPVTVLAKREVGQWPVIGTLARRAGSQFIDRDGLRQLPHAVADLASTLRSGRSVLVFPQATTWCSVLGGRFRRATFQAAADAGAPVRPVTIRYYQHGTRSTTAAFLGDETFGASLHRVARARGLTVRVTAHAPLHGSDRRELAADAQAAVGAHEMPAHV
ncbi:lysophospholipid acyltransferase family protein [Streptomyces durmitorensis]|uniref:1-acyl-sn-glycerol-3-phosphate acyltransferase n=1 Tax=Streptomyces durmitorensis TaxID=319947 RepID=A0ABY4Q412_9ACTN|nr:1-acyl-sn-glycerol-3-phosphate acyltransferase [Streptomyces durmitorensis]UQT59973.1 1-acyl-sn-glycerol-3-phosphate acyltransferase [Streptomyces durmitorensis]